MVASCGDIYRQDLVRVGVKYLILMSAVPPEHLRWTYRIKIQGMRIHVTVLLESSISHALLHPSRCGETLVVSDRPSITAQLVWLDVHCL